MNFVRKMSLILNKSVKLIVLCLLSLLPAVFLPGCGDKVTLPTKLQLNEFENAGPLLPAVDTKNLVQAKIQNGPYRVMLGEVLELTMPSILQAVTKDEYKEGEKYAPYMCRISDSGTITLPLVGELEVAGLTLAQIENNVVEEYYPEYAVVRPSVFARIVEYQTYKVSITGAVNKPGVYSLHNDQMTLVNIIMEAGGIINEGAAVIKITHSGSPQSKSGRITAGTYEHKTVQANQQLADTIDNSFITNTANTAAKKKLDVQLSFKRLFPYSTEGSITVTAGDKILLVEELDITDLLERMLVIKQLLNEPRISILQLEQKLNSLAEDITGRISENPITVKEFTGIPKSFEQEIVLQSSSNISSSPVLPYSELDSEYQQPIAAGVLETETSSNQPDNSKTIVLPVKGLNIPFADVVLEDGDSIIVERLQMPLFSVLGLVNKPGNFQYPTDAQYNLMQAMAFAGGLDRASEPRYATIYRLKPDGTIVHAIFQVVNVKDRTKLSYALNMHIKPGDIIEVEQTPRTRSNVFLDRVFRVNIGTYFNLNDTWQ